VSAVWDFLPFILGGLQYTVGIAVGGLLVALAVGVVVGLLRTSRVRAARIGSLIFVEFFRGTSEVVQMYWIFFALPILLMIRMDPITAAIVVLGLNQGAYIAEIVRGAIEATPRTQFEAAIALNLSPAKRMRHVIFPQALATMLPSLGNSASDIVKATSITSLITVADLTFRAQQVRGVTGESLIVFALIAVMYLVLTTLLSSVFRLAERRLPRGLRPARGRN
jgi:polar amino acid transport system permease protein